MTAVYLLHFDRRFGNGQHYIGFTTHLANRLRDHLSNGNAGSQLVRQARAAGVGWTLALIVEDGTRTDEVTLKRHIRTSLVCPLCSGDPARLQSLVAGRVVPLPGTLPASGLQRRLDTHAAP